MKDRIEKKTLIKAPVNRVWKAIADHKEYGNWFQCSIDRPFEVGQTVNGRMTIEGFDHLTFPMEVTEMKENEIFSCRWPSYVEKTELDLLKQPWLTMEYHLKEVSGGTELTIIESGFDQLDPSILVEAREGNEGGWDFQLENIRKYLESENK